MLTEAQLTELLGSSDRPRRRRAMQGALSVPDLALDVLHAKNVISEVVELSRVTGLGMGLITIRGQMARVLSLLLLHTHRANMVVPTNTEGLLDKHPLTCSAYVMDPMPQSDANPEGIGTVGMHR
jgi:DNA polymerase elongation subunit (family B)